MAIREGLLEHARTETRGRNEIEWVRLASKGVEYLYQHDSPRAILGEMRKMLAVAQSGIPMWQDEILKSLEKLASHITDQMAHYMDRLESLSKRVDEAVRRADVTPELSASLQAVVPWGVDALAYLDRRKAGGARWRMLAAGIIRGRPRQASRDHDARLPRRPPPAGRQPGRKAHPRGPGRERSRSRNTP